MIHASSSKWSAISMLSCAKLGIHFSVVFEDLAKQAIEKRVKIFRPDIIFSISRNKDLIKFFSDLKNTKIKYFYELKNENIKSIKKYKNTNIKSGDSFFSIFTSGSTGDPKGITH